MAWASWLALLGWLGAGVAALIALAALAGHAVFLARRASRAQAVDGTEAFFDAPSGARLCYVIHGDHAATKQYVVYFSGLLGSRREHFGARYPEDPAHCVITLDRPGYGNSSFLARPTRSYRQTGADVVALMRSLGVDKFSVIGWSSGGPYALACALEGKGSVTNCVLVASDPPWASVPRTLPNRLHAVLLVLVNQASWVVEPLLWLLTRLLMLTLAVRKPRSLTGVLEPCRHGVRGTADEMRMERSHWGFELKDLTHAHVYIVHGTRDAAVPVAAASFLHERLPSSVKVTLASHGHAIIRSLWPHLVRLAAEPSPDAVDALLRAANDLRAAKRHQHRVAKAMENLDIDAVASAVRRRTGTASTDDAAMAAGRASLAYD